MSNDQLVVDVGSTDWAGGTAPAGGTHTGMCTLTMLDGVQYVVTHSVAEVEQKMDPHAIGQTTPQWVAFDQPGIAIPVVLDINQVQSIA